jgi:hypothetical protein
MKTTFTFTFTDRDSYKAYRAEWKAKYKKLSADIRQLKQDRRHKNRAFSMTDGSYNKEWTALAHALNALAFHKRQAVELMI